MVKPRCLYEVLSCPQDADEKAVKRAYRKAALEWHPDKNAHREEEATQRFQEIQHAYDVLKDPQERQWYDDHRDSILRGTDRATGGGGGGGGARSGDSINLAKFFFGNAFRGYHAGPDGFYAVFHGCFTQLDELEKSAFYATQRSKTRAAARRSKSAAKSAAADGAAAYDGYARFGGEDASHDEVMEFYSAWNNFSSKRTFAFADPHNPADADGRQVRRLMEKENKAARGKARRAYNDQARSLVDYVKRRDKRLPAAEKWYNEKRRAAQAEVKAKRKAAAQAQHRRRQKEMGDMLRQIRLDELEAAELEGSDDGSDVGGGSGGGGGDAPHSTVPLDAAPLSSSEEEVERVVIECELCRKTFRTNAQLVNHEGSRKHRQSVARLRKVLVAEERRVARAAAKAAKEASFEACAAGGMVDAGAVTAGGAVDDGETSEEEMDVAPIRRKKETKKEKKTRLKQEAAQRRRMGASDASRGGAEDGDDALAASLDALLGVSSSSERPAGGAGDASAAPRAVTLTAVPFLWLDQADLCTWFRAVGLKVFADAVEERQPAPPCVGCAVWLSAAILASPHFDLNQLRQRQVGKKPQQRKLIKLVAEARSAGVALSLLGRAATAEEEARAAEAAKEATAAAAMEGAGGEAPEVEGADATSTSGCGAAGTAFETPLARRETKKEKRKRLKREAAARRARELDGADDDDDGEVGDDDDGESEPAVTTSPCRDGDEGEIVTSTFVDAEDDDAGKCEPVVVGPRVRHRCETCGATFKSRTKLFGHIKQFGHAAVRQ